MMDKCWTHANDEYPFAFGLSPNDDDQRKEELREEEKKEIFELHHDDPVAGHPGVDKTIELITRNHY